MNSSELLKRIASLNEIQLKYLFSRLLNYFDQEAGEELVLTEDDLRERTNRDHFLFIEIAKELHITPLAPRLKQDTAIDLLTIIIEEFPEHHQIVIDALDEIDELDTQATLDFGITPFALNALVIAVAIAIARPQINLKLQKKGENYVFELDSRFQGSNEMPSKIKRLIEVANKSEFKTERDQVFISYSHEDKKWLEELKIMLAPLIRKQKVLIWDDSKIDAGSEWRKEIEIALNSAKVAVLMVSPHFLASEFITELELPQLLKASKEEGLIVLWIHITDCLYKETEIGKYQAAHSPPDPISKLTESERATVFKKICEEIKKAYNS